MKFPNLFIIGAMKAGTSSLHEYLHQHPEIFMSRFKEPQYFCPHRLPNGLLWGEGNPFPESGIDWYLNLFSDAGDAIFAGESTTNYTKMPVVSGCAERIHRYNPKAKLIYLMRDPVERSISHYWYQVAGQREARPMLQAIKKDPQYAAYSHYAYQLRPYLNLFGRENLFLLTLEEIQATSDEVFRRLFRWLGVDADFKPDTSTLHNRGSREPQKLRWGMGWTIPIRRHWRWNQLRTKLPMRLREAANSIMLKPMDRDRCDLAPVIRYLREIQLPQTDELTAIFGRWPNEWTTLQPDTPKLSNHAHGVFTTS